jgi:16S rRNA (guanine1207-N2)-methyltransferase
VLEIFGTAGVSTVGGIAVLPHRGEWLRARARGIDARGWFDESTLGPFAQAVVHLQKGRAATWQGLAEAWKRLADGGRLLIVGGNSLGIKSAVKRLSSELGNPATVIANRARSRVAAWRRDDGEGPSDEAVMPIAVAPPGDTFLLGSAHGVFSADAIDPGTAMLLDRLGGLSPPTRIFDPGCGIGALGLAALRRWPRATAVLADVDRRAVDCARRNASELELASRSIVRWWDAVTEAPPIEHCDLVLLNPPFHTGVPVDLQPAQAMFRSIGTVLAAGGKALVVANRTLPWERPLRELGALRQLADENGFKLLELST